MLIVRSIIKKFKERSPLTYGIVRNASSLAPAEMVQNKESSILKFKCLTERMRKLKWISADESDKAKINMENLLIWNACRTKTNSFHLITQFSQWISFLGFICTKSANMNHFGRFSN